MSSTVAMNRWLVPSSRSRRSASTMRAAQSSDTDGSDAGHAPPWPGSRRRSRAGALFDCRARAARPSRSRGPREQPHDCRIRGSVDEHDIGAGAAAAQHGQHQTRGFDARAGGETAARSSTAVWQSAPRRCRRSRPPPRPRARVCRGPAAPRARRAPSSRWRPRWRRNGCGRRTAVATASCPAESRKLPRMIRLSSGFRPRS